MVRAPVPMVLPPCGTRLVTLMWAIRTGSIHEQTLQAAMGAHKDESKQGLMSHASTSSSKREKGQRSSWRNLPGWRHRGDKERALVKATPDPHPIVEKALQSLWDRVYDELKSKNCSLAEQYEKLLSSKLSSQGA